MSVLKEVQARLDQGHKDYFKKLSVKGGDLLWVQYRDHMNSVRYKIFQGVCISVVRGRLCSLESVVGGVKVVFRFNSLSENIRQVKKVRDRSKRGGRVKLFSGR